MNKKETDILTQCVNTMVVMSDKLEAMFKTVEVLQKHIMKEGDFEYRINYDKAIQRVENNEYVENDMYELLNNMLIRLDILEKNIKKINYD